MMKSREQRLSLMAERNMYSVATRDTVVPPLNVVNLMDALRRSVEAEGSRSAKVKARRPAARRQSEQTRRKKTKRAS
jgi:non-homologous end joining protein Ku